MPFPERELDAYRFLDRLGGHLKRAQDPQQLLRQLVRETLDMFASSAACVAMASDAAPGAQVLFSIPRRHQWDLDLLARFIGDERPARPDDLVLVPIPRHRGGLAALAIARPGRPFDRHDRRLLSRVAEATSEAVQAVDRERLLEIRDRIDRKIREQLHPKDLFYQILDGLRTLTRYDHSSAVLIRDGRNAAMEVAAEQIAWTKAKSARIGRRLPLDPALTRALDAGTTHGFDRVDGTWIEWSGRPVGFLADWLDAGPGPSGDEPREASLLCAPLLGRDGVFGVLKVAARGAGRLTAHDAQLVDRFRTQAAHAIDSLQRTESLEARLVTAERRHAMAELARGVSHDVNNALGAMLPLVQQMRADIREGRHDARAFEVDLDQMEQSLQVCRRIFGGMLAFAKGGSRRGRTGYVRPAVETTLAILRDSIERRRIRVVTELAAGELPPVACGQSDLEQTLLNLLSNARDASREGDTVSVRASLRVAHVEVAVADTGHGIAPEHLPRIFEPFFTTKGDGNGLGLTICRSIVWEAGGTLSIDSTAGAGTRVTVTLPVAAVSAGTGE